MPVGESINYQHTNNDKSYSNTKTHFEFLTSSYAIEIKRDSPTVKI